MQTTCNKTLYSKEAPVGWKLEHCRKLLKKKPAEETQGNFSGQPGYLILPKGWILEMSDLCWRDHPIQAYQSFPRATPIQIQGIKVLRFGTGGIRATEEEQLKIEHLQQQTVNVTFPISYILSPRKEDTFGRLEA